MYYNNGNSNTPSFIISQLDKNDWTKLGWTTQTKATNNVEYNSDVTIFLTDNLTLYSVYQQTITVTYYDNTTTSNIKTGIRYYNSGIDDYDNPSFTLIQTEKGDGWSPTGWSTSSAANPTINYQNNTEFKVSENITLYGCYQKTTNITFVQAVGSNISKSGINYYNSSANNIKAHFTAPKINDYSGWNITGWSTANSTVANGTINKFCDSEAEFDQEGSCTLYALYNRSLKVSFNGNGNTGGSNSQVTGPQYYNAYGTKSKASIKLPSCGFTKTYYSFVNWALGSASGTQYAAGTTVSLDNDTTFYAIWNQSGSVAKAQGNHVCYDTGWEDLTWNSLSITPNNNTYFTLSSNKQYITVNKDCTIRADLSCTNGGGWGRWRLTNANHQIVYWEVGVGRDGEIYTTTASTTLSFSAGAQLYVRLGSYTAVPGAITFDFDNIELKLTVIG